jgi:hypothetical protein
VDVGSVPISIRPNRNDVAGRFRRAISPWIAYSTRLASRGDPVTLCSGGLAGRSRPHLSNLRNPFTCTTSVRFIAERVTPGVTRRLMMVAQVAQCARAVRPEAKPQAGFLQCLRLCAVRGN